MPVSNCPTPTEVQVSGLDPKGKYILSVLAKKTYDINFDGTCAVAEKQEPLVEAPEEDPKNPSLLLNDMDLFPWKNFTDVVVKGHAYGYDKFSQFETSVAVGKCQKKILVVGDRKCSVQDGAIVFSTPEKVDKIPLRYSHAYGGKDEAAEAKYGNPFMGLQSSVEARGWNMERASPFLYPRNFGGCGYLIEPEKKAVEGLRLPNLEDPLDPLTPERLVVGAIENWIKMPLPQAADWFDYIWFPRASYVGYIAHFEPENFQPAEVERGLAPKFVTRERQQPDTEASFRLTAGASLGLQIPYVPDGETVILKNMHPSKTIFTVRLPGIGPTLFTDGRNGKMNSTVPVIHTIVIYPDDRKLTVLWRGAAQALRPYAPEELKKMPFSVDW